MANRNNIIISEWMGISYIRSKSPVKQSAASKASSKRFGIASRASANLRKFLKPVIPDPQDKNMQYALDKAIAKWLATDPRHNTIPVNDLPFIMGFQFNGQSDL